MGLLASIITMGQSGPGSNVRTGTSLDAVLGGVLPFCKGYS